MTAKATGLCVKSRRAVDCGVSGIVRVPELKMLENVLKPTETATVHARKHYSWDEIGTKMAKKGHFLPIAKSGINSEPVSS